MALPSCNFLFSCYQALSHYSSKKRKEYLVLTCGPPSINTSVPEGKGEDEESCSDDETSGDEERQTVSFLKTHLLIYILSIL